MDRPTEHYWQVRLDHLKDALASNHFDVFLAGNADEAKKIVLQGILPHIGAKTVSWGGSRTVVDTGVFRDLKDRSDLEFLDPFAENISPQDSIEVRRKALLVDLFITGTNAVTETGKLVNLDRTGNRVAALSFGPKFVIVLAGRNKIVPDLEEATFRIKNYAAPVVAMRVKAKTPCVQTSCCEECSSPERVCNAWSILEKSYPKGRIKVVLIKEDLGF